MCSARSDCAASCRDRSPSSPRAASRPSRTSCACATPRSTRCSSARRARVPTTRARRSPPSSTRWEAWVTVALKLCGVTHAGDLRACRDAGVAAAGLNLWAGSKRHVELADAERMLADVRAEGPVPKIIGVDVDPDPQVLLVAALRLDLFAVQLH